MKHKMMKSLSWLLTVLTALFVLPTGMPLTAMAASLDFPSTAGQTLTNSNTYTVASTRTITGSAGQNAINIASGATVTIVIPTGVTLTLIGGNGSGTTGGGAGINLPSNATLYIRGGGTLIAKGGAGGARGSGGTGGYGYLSKGGNGTWYGGDSGLGGTGGGGAGAGIGTKGGSGGSGGGRTVTPVRECYTSQQMSGYNGGNGGSGGSSAAVGTLYILDSVSVTATGGAANTAAGYGGGYGGYADDQGSGWRNDYFAGGAGGGGGGGAGGNAAAIGSGGSGGGGGGAGGSGGLRCNSGSYGSISSYPMGGGGYGGVGSVNGNSGSGTRYQTGGSGGSGGGIGGTGSGGTVYKAATATLSISSTSGTGSGVNAVQNILPTVTFDRQGGSGGTSSVSTFKGDSIPAIIPPNPPSASADAARFSGYYSEKGGAGTKYYGSDGSGLRSFDFNVNTILYAYWTYLLTFNNQGVSNTTVEITNGNQLPESVAIPVRKGYEFKGYFSDINGGGDKYYDENGVREYNSVWNKDSGLTVYAQWVQVSNDLTIDPNGGTWNGEASPDPITKGGGVRITIQDPLYGDRAFLGWEQTGSGGALSGKSYTFDTGDPVTLTAKWGPEPVTAFTYSGSLSNITGVDSSASDLSKVFSRIVEDHDKGLTQSDLDASTVTLTLIVKDTDNNASGADEIIEMAQSDTLWFFDVYVEKEVDGSGAITLTEIPVPVKIRIPISSVGDKLGYSVYRYHDGTAELLSSDSDNEEYFAVGTGEIIIYTRKFSTYAVMAHELSYTGRTPTELKDSQKDRNGVDVQALVKEGGGDTYKIDIAWGAMVFDYSVGRYWNPDTHSYDGDRIYAWLPDGYFSNGNNKITAYNHSNMDISVTFDVISELAGVDMTVYAENSDEEETPLAVNMTLQKVPYETAPSPSIDAFLRLTGSPTDTSVVNGGYKKVGVITVTLDALPDNGTTPAGSP